MLDVMRWLRLAGFLAAVAPAALAHQLIDPVTQSSVAGGTIFMTAGDAPAVKFRLQNGPGETDCTTIYTIKNPDPTIASISPASGQYKRPMIDGVDFTVNPKLPGTVTITVDWKIDPNNFSQTCDSAATPRSRLR